MDNELIQVALGKTPADIVIKNGRLVNVVTHEVYETEIAVAKGKIASIGPVPASAVGPDTQIIDAEGMFLAPGFLDAHIHIESSMLSYTEFAKMVVKHGTTAVATDLMEVTIVSGIDGMKEVLAESKNTPVKLYYPIPAFMEENGIQTTGSTLHSEMIDQLITLPEAVGLAEVLAPPILAESPVSAHMLDLAERYRKTAEGHAPAVMGENLNAYVGAGVTSDHESTNREEALAKLRMGLHVLMREGSASTDLRPCLNIITQEHVDTRYCSMVSDDIDALHISRLGHLDNKVRIAVAEGVDPVTAIQMVTLNPAESLRIQDKVGSITPGKIADIVFLSSLEECRVERVIANGELVVDGRALVKELPAPNYSGLLRDTVKLSRKITGDDLVLKADPRYTRAKVHVIGASHDTLLTDALEAELTVEGGVILPDVERDVLRIACVERYGKNGSIGRSFIKNFGLKSGAIAISVGHDHHNISVVGSDAEDMAFAVNRIAELQGGLVLVKDGKVLSEIPLPICGLLSDLDGESVAAKLAEMIEILRTLGCEVPSPNITLSFITLIFIPCLGITDQGLFDVREFKLIDPVISLN
ncbi:adenine deaminase [uncultured Oscillibacter sp.]|uniref:adenine deaminase n=1 Tax=uncultured Oscillibacter sp. TaxID=876091 RepID=UPI0025CC2A8F|nr:adenine deaminase [uncultured Oscillibacter sp.]